MFLYSKLDGNMFTKCSYIRSKECSQFQNTFCYSITESAAAYNIVSVNFLS